MQIIEMEIGRLVPYEGNSRKHSDVQINRLANSIAKFNWTQPIVIDENNIILAGHARYAAAKKLECKKVPVIVMRDLTEADKRAYRIVDNKLALDSEWDYDALRLEVEHLQQIGYEDLEEYDLESLIGEEISADNVHDEWDGMPEFQSEDKEAFRTLIVHFNNNDDVEEFCRRLGNKVTAETRSIWFPKKERTKNDAKIIEE